MAEEKEAIAENYRMEYREVATSHRFYVGLRFIITAFAISLQSGLLNFYNQALQRPAQQQNFTFIPYIGIATMVGVFIMERRNITLYRIMTGSGKTLEFLLGLHQAQFSKLEASRGILKFITYTWSIAFVYLSISVMWIIFLNPNLLKLLERN